MAELTHGADKSHDGADATVTGTQSLSLGAEVKVFVLDRNAVHGLIVASAGDALLPGRFETFDIGDRYSRQ